MVKKMEISKINPKYHERSFSILSGFLTGLFFVILFNLSGDDPSKFIIIFQNVSFFTSTTLTYYLSSILLFSVALLTAVIVTSRLLSERKRNYILCGLTGVMLILVTMLIFYVYGSIDFSSTSQILTILGPASLLLVFLIYAIPFAMIGFIFGYLGSFIVEEYYNLHI
jgi:hypothetical protein